MIRVYITATLDGRPIVDRWLQGYRSRLADVSPAYPEVISVFRQQVAAAFDSEGRTTASGPWAPLKPATIRDRLQHGFQGAHPILQRSRRLRNSLVGTTADSILVMEAQNLRIGSRVPYVVFHQSTAPRKVLPRRPVFEPTTDDKHELTRPIRQWVTGHDPVGRKQVGRG